MIKEIEFEGQKVTFDTETNILKIDGKDLNEDRGHAKSNRIVAKLNKAIRDDDKIDPNNLKLNLGSGFRPFKGFINVDYDKDVYPDIVRDLDEGLPFDTNKFSEVYTSHVIEHIKNVFFFMYEIWRVSKPGTIVTVICPYCQYLELAVQPDHVRFINYGFFDRWRPDWSSVQNELKQTRGAYFNILKTTVFNEGRELNFQLEVVKEKKDEEEVCEKQ